ncbi:hypothetical protein [Streptomyces sp. NPDC017964]|uniref:hypothetical protein n=1 Tax=Streptomyces sp. NPDC017964 TaxID=3365022 RepID=UPI0037AEC7F0
MASSTPGFRLGWRRLVEYVRSRHHAVLQAVAEDYVHTFRAATADLAGTSYTIPPPIVEDVRTGAYAAELARIFRRYALIPFSVVAFLPLLIDTLVWNYQSKHHGTTLYERAFDLGELTFPS